MSVLILSRNVAIYSTRRLSEAFRTRGWPVQVLDPAAVRVDVGLPPLDPPSLNPPSSGLVLYGRPLDAPRVALPRIGNVTTRHALAVVRQLADAGTPLTAGADGIRAARDKLESLQILQAANLAVPPTVLLHEPPEVSAAIARLGGPPVVLKFLTGTHGEGVFLAESEDAARTILEAMWSIERDLIVQRYVREAAGRDLRLFVVGDRVVAAIRRFAPAGGFRANIHRGGRAEAFVPPVEIAALAVKAARCLDLGVAGVDVLESEDGPLVMEVNSSPGLEGVEHATEVDVAGEVADYAIGLASRKSRGRPA